LGREIIISEANDAQKRDREQTRHINKWRSTHPIKLMTVPPRAAIERVAVIRTDMISGGSRCDANWLYDNPEAMEKGAQSIPITHSDR
jgi:hypothetical protein